jgi:hypothetical protein
MNDGHESLDEVAVVQMSESCVRVMADFEKE